MTSRRDVVVLGSTGSIGTQALDVVRANPDRFRVVAMTAGGSNPALFAAQVEEFGPRFSGLGEEASVDAAAMPADVVLNGITGAVGLRPTIAALDAGNVLALANKESLIIGGPVVTSRAGEGQIVPVDSEHSALAQCLRGGRSSEVRRLVLTASGGPFRGRSREDLADVTPEQALAHPTWRMGPKITIDSATLANKGLELIEAHFLFDAPYERIEVVIQPTSIVHSLVRFRDGAALAHLGYPDMRVPISYALTYPERAATPLQPLDLTQLRLEFQAPDVETFPMLALAREAGERGGTFPAAYNAANEVAVASFLAGRLPFLDIAAVVADVLTRVDGAPARDLTDLIHADEAARRYAQEQLAVA